MNSLKVEGIIIKRKDYGEADRILTVFTKYHGKIQIKASGIRRIPSRRSAHVELLNYSLLNLYKGRNMPILTEAQIIDNYSAVKDNFQTIGALYHLCELIDGLCPENQENTKVFDLLKDTLSSLCRKSVILERSDNEAIEPPHIAEKSLLSALPLQDDSIASVIHDFEIALLTTLGYWNQADHLSHNNTHSFIENILERKLKSYHIFAKLQ